MKPITPNKIIKLTNPIVWIDFLLLILIVTMLNQKFGRAPAHIKIKLLAAELYNFLLKLDEL